MAKRVFGALFLLLVVLTSTFFGWALAVGLLFVVAMLLPLTGSYYTLYHACSLIGPLLGFAVGVVWARSIVKNP